MKSIIYILIAVFAAGIIFKAIPQNYNNKKTESTFQCTDNYANNEMIEQSALVMKFRLDNIGLEEQYQLDINYQNKTINIQSEETITPIINSGFLTAKAQVELYECYSRKEVLGLLKNDSTLFDLMTIPEQNSSMVSDAILGYCNTQNIPLVNSYITEHYSSSVIEGINFIWSNTPNSENLYELYLLKKHPAMNKSLISDSHVDEDATGLLIQFNKQGSEKWFNLTNTNINKPIAFVVDQKVCFAPVVKEAINSGSCMLTGDFSVEELKLISILINSDELLLNWKHK
ncbi:MAG: hypothetical protein C0596_10540 [Marinilabiliales bacterium]|nr:MAG: hypothetical protein C0596_10540 [Marinilabiliales bacterium]